MALSCYASCMGAGDGLLSVDIVHGSQHQRRSVRSQFIGTMPISDEIYLNMAYRYPLRMHAKSTASVCVDHLVGGGHVPGMGTEHTISALCCQAQ